ncbi:hypothetical protein F5984_25545 [Rudanella paleaurantiibacter]|uniref:Uncharacterized protein n=1 Tax=Rudanella paleaurantiibacter TaxID=2614655 RepID=A0A7J5TS66_9BACT|nr:hypothetical protein [Rudanella paleaurantiibacter]KAB7725855.1 hypothetical protein F5984_25545 [Rudanella paleaurantiibacter]
MKPIENTMSTAFETRPLRSLSLMQRLLRQHPEENAIIEVNNLLANRPIRTITRHDLTDIEQRYSFPLSRFMLNLEEFYAVHLNYKLSDKQLGTDGLSDLEHLRTLFNLPPSTVEMLHAQIGKLVYKQRVEDVIKDGHISETDKVALSALQQLIPIPVDLTDSIYKEVCQDHLNKLTQKYSYNARISPEEEHKILTVSKNLGTKLSANTRRHMERYMRYWAIENSDLPVIEVAITLQKLEVCHCQASDVQWFEERVTVRRTNYTDRFEHRKTLDIVDLTSNVLHNHQDTFDIIKLISSGSLYVTNKRLIFESPNKTTSIKIDSIVQVKAYKQGILIDKITGKSMLLLINRDSDTLTLICQRLLTLKSSF